MELSSAFVSDRGCVVSLIPVAGWADHLGDGALLTLRMVDPNDDRRAEVYLSRVNLRELRNGIEAVLG